jgi:hypothetical protein
MENIAYISHKMCMYNVIIIWRLEKYFDGSGIIVGPNKC